MRIAIVVLILGLEVLIEAKPKTFLVETEDEVVKGNDYASPPMTPIRDDIKPIIPPPPKSSMPKSDRIETFVKRDVCCGTGSTFWDASLKKNILANCEDWDGKNYECTCKTDKDCLEKEVHIETYCFKKCVKGSCILHHLHLNKTLA